MNIYVRRIRTRLLLCLTILGITPLLLAQATTGTITGAVSDLTGAIVPGATVTVRNIDTNISRMAPTGDQGRYSFPALPIGNYEVTVDLTGFGKVVRGPVVLTLNEIAVVDVELKPAGVTAEVTTITDDAPILNATNAEVGVRFDDKRLSNLPTRWFPRRIQLRPLGSRCKPNQSRQPRVQQRDRLFGKWRALKVQQFHPRRAGRE